MEVLEDKENSFFNRREIKIIAEAGKNPSYEEALNIIAENFKSEKENIAIKRIKGKFGRNTFLIEVFVYKSREEKEKFEPRKKEKAVPGQEQSQPADSSAEKK